LTGNRGASQNQLLNRLEDRAHAAIEHLFTPRTRAPSGAACGAQTEFDCGCGMHHSNAAKIAMGCPHVNLFNAFLASLSVAGRLEICNLRKIPLDSLPRKTYISRSFEKKVLSYYATP
jgi:hypothetical protein